ADRHARTELGERRRAQGHRYRRDDKGQRRVHPAATGHEADEDIDARTDRHAEPVEHRLRQRQRADEAAFRPIWRGLVHLELVSWPRARAIVRAARSTAPSPPGPSTA